MDPTTPEETGLLIQSESGLSILPSGGAPALSEIINRSVVHIQSNKALATHQPKAGNEIEFEIAPGVKMVMCWIPPEASRVHGYTREILERDGSPPSKVYEEFAAYAGSLPIAAYNLEYDWDKVLVPEWKRLGIPQIGVPGFCALKLAQRLLDPVPAGNCKLQTLRQYYRLPENGAHTALGDVLTVIDLMQQVLRPLAEKRGLDTWEKIVGFAGDEWFPSRLPFGRFKGRLYQEAREDAELRSWLVWLAESTNERSSRG